MAILRIQHGRIHVHEGRIYRGCCPPDSQPLPNDRAGHPHRTWTRRPQCPSRQQLLEERAITWALRRHVHAKPQAVHRRAVDRASIPHADARVPSTASHLMQLRVRPKPAPPVRLRIIHPLCCLLQPPARAAPGTHPETRLTPRQAGARVPGPGGRPFRVAAGSRRSSRAEQAEDIEIA